MGRDDARAIPGLQGGRAPARAFHDFMVQAVAKRPVEPFETQAVLPDWVVEPDEEAWFGQPNGMMVDPDGNPLQPADPNAPVIEDPIYTREKDGANAERMDREWIERQIAPRGPPGSRQPVRPPRDSEPAEPVQ
jgi:penicillin-binding protein 1A